MPPEAHEIRLEIPKLVAEEFGVPEGARVFNLFIRAGITQRISLGTNPGPNGVVLPIQTQELQREYGMPNWVAPHHFDLIVNNEGDEMTIQLENKDSNGAGIGVKERGRARRLERALGVGESHEIKNGDHIVLGVGHKGTLAGTQPTRVTHGELPMRGRSVGWLLEYSTGKYRLPHIVATFHRAKRRSDRRSTRGRRPPRRRPRSRPR